MKVEFLTVANQEYLGAIEFYNLQDDGLGLKFKKEVDSSIKRIIQYPDAWMSETVSTRRILLKMFPYKIVYLIDKDKVVVAAIANTHRRPFYWVSRLV